MCDIRAETGVMRPKTEEEPGNESHASSETESVTNGGRARMAGAM